MVIAAHPDEANMYAGGTATLFSHLGYQVKFESITCGDSGYHEMGRYALAERGFNESQEAARRLGVIEYDMLNERDGVSMPTSQT